MKSLPDPVPHLISIFSLLIVSSGFSAFLSEPTLAMEKEPSGRAPTE